MEDLSGCDATPLVTLLSPDDLEVATSTDVGPSNAMKTALTAGQWIIAASDADGGGGPNHWYYLLWNADNAGNNIPWEEEDNGMASSRRRSPRRTPPTPAEDPSHRERGAVNEAGDNDWFSICPEDASGDNEEGEAAQWVVVCANSHLWGASTNPYHVYDSAGSVLGEAETDASRAQCPDRKHRIAPGETINIRPTPVQTAPVRVTSGTA